jgi:hypothetical protein
MIDRPEPPSEEADHEIWEEEAPPDALPANPAMRKIVIAIYILIVVCVVLGLLLSMIWSGLFVDDWSLPLPDAWSI